MNTDLMKLPNHIAFIIDGNGRWAKNRGLTRSMGHKAGFKNLEKIIKECFYSYDMPIVSIYAFSTENWNRPQKEVDYLFSMFDKWMTKDFKDKFPQVKLNVMGDCSRFPGNLADKAKDIMEATKDDYKYILNLGVNYSGQDELVMAINKIIDEKIEFVDKETIANHLYTAGQPPVDFMIRTSGECRVSNFMLWQLAYAEFYFTDVHWPAFTKKNLKEALLEFQRRDRRFGAIKE